ncbi:hypothetical protein QVD17_33923 [Tagetes erecta]|uniref:PHD-type domain-containing protein n=1 Tax=Tagetes erecta TaxID=13708 RepID=A0AAD8NK36_TARER|nr:hypothetical protein QVD17_33923 [Tagetes erecta]
MWFVRMRLRSNRVFNRGKPKTVSKIKNDGFSNERRLSLRSSKSSYGKKGAREGGGYENLEMGVKETLSSDEKGLIYSLRSNESNYGKKGASEAGSCENIETGVKETLNSDEKKVLYSLRSNESKYGKRGVNEAENLEMGMVENVKTVEKGLALGLKVLDSVKDLVVSCSKEESEEDDGNESIEIPTVDCENGFKSLESETCAADTMIVNGDDVKETSLNDPGNADFAGDTTIVNGDDDKETSLNDTGNADDTTFVNGDDTGNGNFADDTSIVNGDDDDKETSLNDPGNADFADDTIIVNDDDKETSVSDPGNANFVDDTTIANCDDEETSLNDTENANFADDTTIVNGDDDDDKETSLNDPGNANVLGKCEEVKGKGRRKRKKKVTSYNERISVILGLRASNDECKLVDLKHEKGKKRKNLEAGGSKCNGRAKKVKVEEDESGVSGKVLRSRNLTASSGGGVTAVNSGLRALVVGLKCSGERPKNMLKRRARSPKVLTEGEKTRPKKKLKRRGKPCKLQSEDTPLPLNGIPKKKRERRARPSQVSHEIPVGDMKLREMKQKLYGKGITLKKFKGRGRPPIMEEKTLATHVIRKRTVRPMSVKKSTKNCKNVKSEENSEQLMVEGEILNAGKGIIDGNLPRKQLKQLIRDKISNVFVKCGWTVDFKRRQEKSYLDAVYIEPNGKRSHWSITEAYAKLKWKIENGRADDIEMSAFTPVPIEEVSLLFRYPRKERKKYDKKSKNVKKGKIVTNKKKKHGKKSKDGSKKKMIFKPRILVRGSESGSKQDNEGALAIKKRNLLSWMIDLGVMLVGTKVRYGNTRRQKRSSGGIITTDGISCGCCNEVMGITKFVGHCGGKFDQIFDNIYLESGKCLRKCLMDSWRKEEESNIKRFNVVEVRGDDPNDDTCNICGDGGNLICCDGCPSTFHQSCLDVQNFPSGDWNCIYCTCKFCGVVSVSTGHVEDSQDSNTSEMLSCCLCEEKFHQLCLQEGEDVNTDSNTLPFCGRKCQELFERLQTHLGVKHELEDGFSWTLLQRSDVDHDSNVLDSQLKVEHNSKLAVAFSVLDECFVPIVDERSGASIIRNVVYNCGSNFRRLNYAGFLTAVLEKDDEFITAASIRIHGYRLAEMPFIGTRHTYRRQGMCRRLLDAIESTLSSLGVEELIIPAIPALLKTWTNVFGFMPLEESKKQAIKCMSLMVFPGIAMLKKPLHRNQPVDVDHAPKAAGIEKDVIDHEQKEETNLLMDGCSSPEPNNNPQFETTSSNATDYKQTSADTAGVGNDIIDYDQAEKETVQMDLENDKLTVSNGANNLCDLNLPVKNVLPCDTDGQTSVDSESFPDCTIEPSSFESMVCGNPESSEVKLDIEHHGVPGVKVKASPMTSNLVLKNTFDLNLHPTAVEADVPG